MKHFEASQKTPKSIIILLVILSIVGIHSFQEIKKREAQEHSYGAAANSLAQPIEHIAHIPYVEIGASQWIFAPVENRGQIVENPVSRQHVYWNDLKLPERKRSSVN